MSLKLCFSERAEYGASPSKSAPRTPLDNTIHPIFKRANFRREYVRTAMQNFYNGHEDWKSKKNTFSDVEYKRIEPALRLATLLIAKSGPFYTKLMCAQIRRSEISGDFMYETSFAPSDRQFDAVENEFLQIANRVRFCVSDYDHDVKATQNGKAWLGKVYASLRCGEGFPTPQIQLCVGLSHVFAEFFEADIADKPYVGFELGTESRSSSSSKGKQHTHNTPDQRTHALFLLANTLAHYVAKALFQWRMLSERGWHPDKRIAKPQYGNSGQAEPLFSYTDSDNDLGRAWQIWFWGAVVKPINPALDPEKPVGFYFLRWAEATAEQHQEKQPGKPGKTGIGIVEKVDAWPLDMQHVQRLFSREIWEPVFRADGGISLGKTPMRALVAGRPGFDEVIHEYFAKRLEVGASRPTGGYNAGMLSRRFGTSSSTTV